MKPKITIIDGNSLLFRAYFATAYPGVEIMRNKDGIPTNAIFAFSNMINRIISSLNKGDSLFVAFDAKKHNFRHETLESYKANRKPTPEDLLVQLPIAREMLKALGIYYYECEGFEGDDIAGTVAKLAKDNNYEVNIYTSDRDFLQLADEDITINILKKGLSDILVMTPEEIKNTYGFEPKQIIDYKGLRGDTSDNLPGIPGIGEKTAVKLIQEFHSFDEIINNVDKLKGKIKESIIEHKNLGLICRDLAIIKTDVPLPFTINDTLYDGYNFQTLSEFCLKYGFKQLLAKASSKWKKENNEQKITVNTIQNTAGIAFGDKIGIALDYSDDNYHSCDILGLGVSNGDKAYYIDFEDAKKDQNLLNILKNPDIKKNCYDYKAINIALDNHKIIIDGLNLDILISSYVLDSSLKNNPSFVLSLYGIDLSSGNSIDDQITLFSTQNKSTTTKLAYYSLSLENHIKSELEKIEADKLYYELEKPLIEVLIKMEKEGFPLDVKTLDEYGNTYKENLEKLSKEIYLLAGTTFNISSIKQLGDVLFNKLGLPSNKKGSTSIDNLKELVGYHPIIEKLIEYRKYFKLVTTYIDGLKPYIHEDGKIHACFNQAVTATGRLSSSNPNLQNISIRSEEGKNIRKAFFYPSDNYLILSLDYSQIELRILASLSNSQTLKNIFLNDEDIHSATAKKIFHLENEPSPLQRRQAKAVNFGIIYGISDWGLAEQIDVSRKEAKNIIDSFYLSYPEIGEYFQNIIVDVTKNEYSKTILGRRRYLKEVHDGNYQVREFAKRAAMNAPIQGSAADLIKLAMIKVDKALTSSNLKTKMVLQIHDELIFKVPKDEKDIAYQIIKETMEHALEIDVPLCVDGGFGTSWYDAK